MLKKSVWLKLSGLLALLLLLSMASPITPTSADIEPVVYIVNDTRDLRDVAIDSVCDADHTMPGEQCTLRAAIDEGNACTYEACGDYVTIEIPAGTFTLTLPGRNEDHNVVGDLDITNTQIQMTIQGAGAGKTIIDANSLDRVFQTFYTETNVAIRDVTIRGGRLEQTWGSEYQPGGGICHSNGWMTLSNVIIEDNTVVCLPGVEPGDCVHGVGGGISAYGNLLISSSTLRNNYASLGGGIYYDGLVGWLLTIRHSTLSGNSAIIGGAIYTMNTTYLYNSTVSGNSAGIVGGVDVAQKTTRLVNVTISSNAARVDGANLSNGGDLRLVNSMIANPISNSSILPKVSNCDNSAGATWTSFGYNMTDDGTCLLDTSGDHANSRPMLTSLMWLGGPTQTHGLLPGSPAHDAKNNFCIDFSDGLTVTSDQRGSNRDAKCDIGAFEGVAYAVYLPVIRR